MIISTKHLEWWYDLKIYLNELSNEILVAIWESRNGPPMNLNKFNSSSTHVRMFWLIVSYLGGYCHVAIII